MDVKTGNMTLYSILVTAMAAHCDQECSIQGLVLPHLLCELPAVHIRHGQVEEGDVG